MHAAGPPLSNTARPLRKVPVRRPIGRDRALWRMMIVAASRVHLAHSVDSDCQAALLFSLLGLTLSLAFATLAPEGFALLGVY